MEGLVERVGRADFDLDGLRRTLADQQVVLALQELHDGFVHLVAGHAHGARVDDAGERDDGHVGGAAADIHHHVAVRLGDGQPRADGRHHGLFHQVHFTGLGAVRRIRDRALFHLRDFARHPDDDARMDQHLAPVRFLNEVIQHALGDFEIGDDAVFHRLDGDDIAGSAPQHILGFLADGYHLAVVLVDGDDGGLVDNDPLAFGEDQGVGRSQIDGQVRRKQTEKRA